MKNALMIISSCMAGLGVAGIMHLWLSWLFWGAEMFESGAWQRGVYSVIAMGLIAAACGVLALMADDE